MAERETPLIKTYFHFSDKEIIVRVYNKRNVGLGKQKLDKLLGI